MQHDIEVLAVELTTKNDIGYPIYPNVEERELDFEIFKSLIEQNKKLEKPIKIIDLCGLGNPLLYSRLKDVIELLAKEKMPVSVWTNGYNLKDIITYYDDALLQYFSFNIYLMSADEKKNDQLAGKPKAFKRTIEAIEYLMARMLRYSIFMPVIPENHEEIGKMMEVAEFYRCNVMIPIEVFPFIGEKYIMSDDQKSKVLETINGMVEAKYRITRNIQFEKPPSNCTYLRYKRIFVNSWGMLSFCHFISPLKNTEITDMRKISLEEAIEINNKTRNIFLADKFKEISDWNKPRDTSSPCSYCIYKFGVKAEW